MYSCLALLTTYLIKYVCWCYSVGNSYTTTLTHQVANNDVRHECAPVVAEEGGVSYCMDLSACMYLQQLIYCTV